MKEQGRQARQLQLALQLLCVLRRAPMPTRPWPVRRRMRKLPKYAPACLITGTVLTSGNSDSGSSTHNTASVSPSANRLVIVQAAAYVGATTPPASLTATGNSLTYVAIDSTAGTSASWGDWRHTVFRAMGASPTAGAITINVGMASYVGWHVMEFAGIDTSGTNGSGAIVQSDNNAGTGTAASGALSAFGDAANNVTFHSCSAGRGGGSSDSITFPTLTTTLAQVKFGFSDQMIRGGWQVGQDTSPDATISVSQGWSTISFEIKDAAGGGGGAASLTPSSRTRRLLTRF